MNLFFTSMFNVGRSMFNLPICLLILASGLSPAHTLPDQDISLEILPTGEKLLHWTGHPELTYFLQASPDLQDWTWAPNIEPGIDGSMSYEVDGPAAAGFYRLQYTDQAPAPGETVGSADYDGDGYTNLQEITPRPRPGGIVGYTNLKPNIQTNPLRKDTDGDGLDDKWEEEHGLDPTDDGSRNTNNGPNGDPDGDGVNNLGEQQAKSDPRDASAFPIQVIQITKGSYGHSEKLINQDDPYTGSCSWGAWWISGDWHQEPIRHQAVTPIFQLTKLDPISFPETPPARPVDQPWLVDQRNLDLADIFSSSAITASPTGGSLEVGVTISRVWIKAPPASHEQKFVFLKIRRISTHNFIENTNTSNFIDSESVEMSIPAGQTVSSYVDLKCLPVISNGCVVTAYAYLRSIEFRGYATKEVDDVVNPPLAENSPSVPTVTEKMRITQADSPGDLDDTEDTDFKTEVKTSLKIAQFGGEELFTSDQAGNCTFVHTAFKQDLDIFRVRLPDYPMPAGHTEHRIKIWTTKQDGTTILDPGAEVDLNHFLKDPSDPTSPYKFHETAALALVADTEVETTDDVTDDKFAVEGHGDGLDGDRTYRAVLGGTVKIKWLTAQGQPEFQIPVSKGRDVHVTGFLMPGGANQAQATRWFERAKEIYSAIDVNLIYDFKTLSSLPAGVDLDNGLRLPTEIGDEHLIQMEPETIAMMNVLKLPDYQIAADTIPVFFVTKLVPEDIAVGYSTVPSLMAPNSTLTPDNESYGGAIFIDSGHKTMSALAHELAHILLDAGHQPSTKALWNNDFRNKKCYVWWGDIKDRNPQTILNGDWADTGINAHRRFRDSMRSRIWKSKYVNPPKP